MASLIACDCFMSDVPIVISVLPLAIIMKPTLFSPTVQDRTSLICKSVINCRTSAAA
jgi:hypothetical protein